MTPQNLNAPKSQSTDVHGTRSMKRLLVPLLSCFVVTQFASADEPRRERIEWFDIWVTDADVGIKRPRWSQIRLSQGSVSQSRGSDGQ
jgi:hypothetical protein